MSDKMSALFRPLTSPSSAFFTAFIAVFLLVLGTSILITFILPESYASTAKIRVESDDAKGASGAGSKLYDPYFIQTEFEVLQSQLVLNPVIQRLNLQVNWGKRYYNGEKLKTAEVLVLLKGRLRLTPVRNTSIIEITVYSEDRHEAAELANAIAESYRDYRAKAHAELVSKGMAALLQQFAEQETELRQLQARTEDFRQKFKIASDAVAIQASAEQPYWELKQQLEQRLDLQRLLTAKIDAAKLDAQMPRTLVQIIDTAEPGRAPVRPNKPLDIMIGAVAGGGLGLLAGAASALFSARFGGRGRKPVAAG